jgi:transcription initiation factor IIE alpha subunit
MIDSRYPQFPGFRDRDTSQQAAELVTGVGEMHKKIMEALRERPMIDYELAERFNVQLSKVQPRRSELAAQGKIVDSGMRRMTPYKRNAIVWKVSDAQFK